MITGLPAAIEHDAQIQLAGHLQPLFDQHAPDDAAFGAGLVRDEGHADHVARELDGLGRVLRQLDAAAFAAAARMDLRLDHHQRAAQALGDLAGFDRIGRDLAARYGHAVARQNRFCLIFVDFHDGRKFLMLTCVSL